MGEKLWTKNFIIVSFINFSLSLVFYLLMVTIGIYAAEQFHVSASIAGLVTGIYIIGILIGRLGIGRFIDNIGSKKILEAGLLLYIIVTALYFGAVNIPLLLIVRLLHGFTVGIAMTAAGTIIALIIPAGKRGEGIGYFSMSAVVAAAIGPFLGIFLSQHAGFQIIFVFCLLLGIINLSVGFKVDIPSFAVSPKIRKTGIDNLKPANFFEYKALPISIVVLIAGLAYSGVLAFIVFYAKEIGLVEAAGFYFLVYAVTTIISRPFTGRLLDAKGANIVAYPALLIFSAGMLLLSQARFGITLLSAGAIIGLGFGNFVSIAQTISIKHIPPQRLGLATATFAMFFDFGLGFGPYLLGLLVPSLGYRGLYSAMVIVILAAVVIYHFLYGIKENSNKLSLNYKYIVNKNRFFKAILNKIYVITGRGAENER